MTTATLPRRGRARLSVGLNAADPLRLGRQLDELAGAGVELVHIDVMDGRFAGPLTGGAALAAAAAERFAVDVHLMVEDPERHVEAFLEAGVFALTFHVESTPHPHRLLRRLDGTGVLRGVALNPGTPVEALAPLVEEIELALVLGIDPGRRDVLRPATAERVRRVRELTLDADVLMSVDGGIAVDGLGQIAALGCDLVVAGSAVFAAGTPGATAAQMQRVLRARADTGGAARGRPAG
jgi:ribulose-phosphate 3-epimerase